MIEELRRTGLVRLGVVPWIEEFVAHLAKCERYPGHVKARPRDGVECHAMTDVMAAPYFLDYAKSFTPLASEYFAEPATLWSLNAFWTDERTPFLRGLNGVHRDREADKIVCLFILGTDANIEAAQLLAHDDSPSLWHAIYGPRGTAWLADTTHRHCGQLPTEPRMLCWARWAAPGIPLAKHTEQLPEIP